MFKRIYYLLVFLILICLLVGCKDQYLTINYNDNSYDLVYDWEMATDDYEIITVTESNTNLNLRLYNNDNNNEFIYCENNGSLYHNNKFKYPLNKSSNVSSLKFLSKENKETDDREVINEFIAILSGQYKNKIDVRDNLLTVAINYNDYPAILYCGCIVKDKYGDYWLRYDNTIFDIEKNDFIYKEKFYSIPSESKLCTYINLNNKLLLPPCSR